MHFLFARRYFSAPKSTNAINIIAWVSVLAIVVGTTALILVLSVFNGFEGLVKSLYSSFYTDLRISPANGKVLTLTPEQLQKIKAVPGVKNISLVAEEKGVLQNGDYQSVVYIKGVDENHQYVAGIAGHLVKGEYELGDSGNANVILGAGIENAVGIQADRNLTPLMLYLPKRGVADATDPMNAVAGEKVNTNAVFMIQQDFDNKYGITNLDFVKWMLGMAEDEYSGAELALTGKEEAEAIKQQLRALLGKAYKVETRYEQNQSLYAVMRAEKWVIYAILSLILVVAAFTMIGALTMLVLEKKKDIAVLHALGADKSFIQKIFLSEGILLAMMGGAGGMLLALLLGLGQQYFHWIPLQGGSFLIDYFPVEMHLFDFLLVGATVFVIAVLASWIPARKAAEGELSLRSE